MGKAGASGALVPPGATGMATRLESEQNSEPMRARFAENAAALSFCTSRQTDTQTDRQTDRQTEDKAGWAYWTYSQMQDKLPGAWAAFDGCWPPRGCEGRAAWAKPVQAVRCVGRSVEPTPCFGWEPARVNSTVVSHLSNMSFFSVWGLM